MIGKAIENWLINTSEKYFTLPFCQVLINEGHEILKISSHGPGELGKDIISRNSDKNICVFQLKSGNITKDKWRGGIRGEIVELMEVPPIHPSIDQTTKIEQAFLVTNGKIVDEVKVEIRELNLDVRRRRIGYPKLDIYEKDQLLLKFIECQGQFLPSEELSLDDFYKLLEFYLEEGDGFISKEKFFNFFNKTIFDKEFKSKSQKKTAIASAIVIAGYLLNSYQRKNNYFALFEAWTSLAACVIRFCEHNKLEDQWWYDSWDLIMEGIEQNLKSLRDEVLAKDELIEGIPIYDLKLIRRARKTICYGTLAAFEIYCKLKDTDYKLNTDLIEKIKIIFKSELWFWGESAFPFYFFIIKFLELTENHELAKDLIYQIFQHAFIDKYPESNGVGVAFPYYSVEDLLEYRIERNCRKIDFKQFFRRSFLLESLIHMIVRRDGKQFLKENWRKISHFVFFEFIPDKPEDFFNWHVIEGRNHSRIPNHLQSWKELKEIVSNRKDIPDLVEKNYQFLIFFILVCPFRLDIRVNFLLDQKFCC